LRKRCARGLRSQDNTGPDIRLPAGDALVIPLSALPLACWCSAGAALPLLASAVQLIAGNQVPLAIVLLAAAGTGITALRRDLWLRGPAAPVRLEVRAQGSMRIYCRNGIADEVHLQAHSLRLGGGFLLVLRGRRSYRLLLASGNVEPVTLAALHRRLGRGSAGTPGLS